MDNDAPPACRRWANRQGCYLEIVATPGRQDRQGDGA